MMISNDSALPSPPSHVTPRMQVLRCWRELAVTERIHREEANRQVETAKSHLSLARARRILRRWREEVEEGRRERVCLWRAVKHYHQKLGRKALRAWLVRLRLTQRKTALSQRCDWFESSRLLASCYSKWRLQVLIYANIPAPSASSSGYI